jgi:4-amino-4-deoxy-L-arabinose transferase-like glycosyltransferase
VKRGAAWWRSADGAVRAGPVIAAALLAFLAAFVVVMSRSEPRLAGSNTEVAVSGIDLALPAHGRLCQGGELVPADGAAVRVYISATSRVEPAFTIAFAAPGQPTRTAVFDPHAGNGPRIAPLTPPGPELDGASACLTNRSSTTIRFAGDRTPANPDLKVIPGRGADGVRIDYLRRGRESGWQLAGVVARRFALLKASFFGAWTLWAVAAVLGAIWAAAIVIVLRTERIRRASLACAALAIANAALWAVVTPPLQVPDEPYHVGYVQYLAETGSRPPGLPPQGAPPRPFSDDEQVAFDGIPFSIEGRPSWSAAHVRAVRASLARPLSRHAAFAAGQTAAYPPLYYAYEAIPYLLARSSDFLDRLVALRLFSALLAGLTVWFVYAFLRELLPGARSLWTIGALCVAFQPLFGFLAGGVNSDDGLFACSAALLWLLARAFRRGLSARLIAALAIAIVAGLLTKRGIVVLLPAALLGLVLAAWRSAVGRRWARVLLPAAVAAPALVYLIVAGALGHRSLLAIATGDLATGPTAPSVSLRGQLSYLWQSFLPRLPFMTDQFPGYPHFRLWDVYFQGFVGRFGWFQFGFPLWVDWLALAIAASVLALAGRELWRRREVLRRRWPELGTYVLMLGSLLVALGVVGYRFRAAQGASYEQARYLLPLLPLYAALIALAVRSTGRRLWRATGALAVVLAMGQSLFAMLLEIGRYYT